MAYLTSGPDGSIDLQLALAGHPAPAVVRRDGSVEMVGRYGTMAGLGPDIAVHDVDVHLEAGECLLLYTDGVTEAGPRRTPFGEAGLASVLSGMGGHSPAGRRRRRRARRGRRAAGRPPRRHRAARDLPSASVGTPRSG